LASPTVARAGKINKNKMKNSACEQSYDARQQEFSLKKIKKIQGVRVVGVAACKAMMLGGKSASADAELASLLAMHLGPSSRGCGKLGTVSVVN
jgi:hypothetical protein